MRFATLALLTLASLAACGRSEPASSGSAPVMATPAAAAREPTAAEKATLLASLPAPYNAGDLANGQARFAVCRSCHTITPGGPDMTGPNLHGVFGRVAGTKPGYIYSAAVKSAGFTWDAQHLDGWLAAPRTYLPGTKMSFAGLKAETDRRDLIAYLKVETGYRP